MSMPDRLAATEDSLNALTGDESRLYEPLLALLPVDGLSISTFGHILAAETISASDAQSFRLDELQFDLGEGPCWDALETAAPVLEPDIRERPNHVWPAFSEAIIAEDFGALFAFPLMLGPLRIGAIDLYTNHPFRLGEQDIRHIEILATVVSRMVLSRALRLSESDLVGEADTATRRAFSRREIHQATGMVLAQLGIPATDAFLVIQGHAFAAGRSMLDISAEIIDRRLSFAVNEKQIEGSHD
ncbi:GAF and ANTAR domain-containing protein [Cryobacterium glucosi]|uniref:ANTAR domain-containing protein n=1 Tax=Cryobacterium glucosi TaxID=1259175 RepID=A0ABY2IS16_9MICO|nr:GAF and ANTAR domain-containing protein [Cryobacterium glucosi]MEB0003977.1 GAF and ANTAR domain-containing protein [Cryobacterium sp. RTC2.1]TFB96373.1 ANTAR domain-containing protein [Cryobacterium sp. MDB2-A-1]TFC03313.1 ANTAR domain-containing protein [Cryobacterium sp. MDB2-33-2]TFC12657.1 ANTAR domain-containing protein [Cryobacterium sp. MDB2-A-2]TFC17051.1 ANTAR domain-containing protein [Cryobacterium sp. MDB2-10]